jgi:hypothetical protein
MAFRQGMADLINLEWLRMFDHHELQVLISGALVPVDIEDLKLHTNTYIYWNCHVIDPPWYCHVIVSLWIDM